MGAWEPLLADLERGCAAGRTMGGAAKLEARRRGSRLDVGGRVTTALEGYPHALRLAAGRKDAPLEPGRYTGFRP